MTRQIATTYEPLNVRGLTHDSNLATIFAFIKGGPIVHLSRGPFRVRKVRQGAVGRVYFAAVLDMRRPAGDRHVWHSGLGWTRANRLAAVKGMVTRAGAAADLAELAREEP